jgi:transcriptional regulator with XRE-family HTH domain
MKDDRKRAIGKRIREIRLIDLEMNQTEFAKAVGTTQAIISRIEKGLTLPTMEVLCQILDLATNRTSDWIIKGH